MNLHWHHLSLDQAIISKILLTELLTSGKSTVRAFRHSRVSFIKLCISCLLPEGRRHDAGMLTQTGLLQELQQYAFSPTGQPMCVYGDLAYPLRVHLQTPFRRMPLTALMQDYNASMSAVRISVKWLFGDIINSFKFKDYKKNLKIGLSSVNKMYVVRALLRNAITCLCGNQTSDYFDLKPPTLQEYFQ